MHGQQNLFTVPDIIDNRTEGGRLCDVLNLLLSPRSEVYIASGYFNADGFGLVKEKLGQVAGLRLLLGREPGVGDEVGRLLSRRLRGELEETMGRKETPAIIRDLLAFLGRNEVKVRLYRKGFFHGKAYIIEGVPMFGEVAIVGSSNFTAAGLTANYELNTVRKQETAVHELKGWFEEFWNEAEDYKEQLIGLLSDFTAKYRPYEIYIKALYEYFKDKLKVDLSPTDDKPSPIVLADFQHDGYMAAKDILETYGGVLIADSVGLGKTYLGLQLLDDYAYQLRQKALLVCPAQLREVLWEPELRNVAIRADIVHQERVSQSTFPIEDYQDFDLILVDESHNFRSTSANRWDNLMCLAAEGKPKKVILMTATPVNNSVFDLYNQLRLITKDQDDFFARAGIDNLRGYFLRAEANKEPLYDLLEEIAVRRSRQFIKEYYPDARIDGQPVNFPERRLHSVRYNLEQTYAGLYQEVADAIENLNLASYNVEAYRKKAQLEREWSFEGLMEQLIRMGWSRRDAERYLKKLGRGTALVHILKVLYLKRLESSVEALRISVERQMRFQEKFLEFLKEGKLLDAVSYRRIFIWNSTDETGDEEEEVEALIEALPEVDPEAFDLDAIERAVREDMEALRTIHTQLEERLAVEYDDKLCQLKKKLLDLRDKKVVVFTYFKDTARYLYRHLGGRDPRGRRTPEGEAFLRTLGHERLSITDSEVKPEERKDRIQRFSPVSNKKPKLKGTDREIDLLVSTDVLSEGQNLQDADTVINYDLHWNPVRMIQRAGRIDRIGSLYDTVHVYNFFPEDALESLLGLVGRLYEKLDGINRSGIGLDASVLGEVVRPQEFNALRRMAAEDETVMDELERMSELEVGEFLNQELLDFLKRTGEERLKRIPLGVGSGKKGEGRQGLFVYLKGGGRHFWCYYDLNTGHIDERKLEVIKRVRCTEDTPYTEPNFDVYDLIDRVKRYIIKRLKQSAYKPSKLKSPQNQVVNWLQSLAISKEVKELIDYFSNPLPESLLKELRGIWKVYRGASEDELLQILGEFSENHPLQSLNSTKPPILAEEDLQLVCWMALVG